jgi:hypothetical protein
MIWYLRFFLQHFYTKQFKVENKNDRSLVEEIATSIHNMTQLKLNAIQVSSSEGFIRGGT